MILVVCIGTTNSAQARQAKSFIEHLEDSENQKSEHRHPFNERSDQVRKWRQGGNGGQAPVEPQ